MVGLVINLLQWCQNSSGTTKVPVAILSCVSYLTNLRAGVKAYCYSWAGTKVYTTVVVQLNGLLVTYPFLEIP